MTSSLKFVLLVSLTLMFSCKSQSKSTAAEAKTKVSTTESTVEPTNEVKEEIIAEAPKGMEQEVPEKDWPADVIAGISRTPCFGTCPVYEFRLNQDLSAQLEANQFTDIEGNYTTKVSRAKKDELFEAMQAASYFSLDENYDGPVTDLPSTFLIFSVAGRAHKVHARFETPEDLDEFISFFENWVFSLDWK